MWIFTFKLAGKPFGIWLAWVALAYSSGVYLGASWPNLTVRPADVCVFWPITIASAFALLRRRLIALTLAGMTFALLLYHCVAHGEPVLGMLLAPLGFLGLLINRRWFDERLLRIG